MTLETWRMTYWIVGGIAGIVVIFCTFAVNVIGTKIAKRDAVKNPSTTESAAKSPAIDSATSEKEVKRALLVASLIIDAVEGRKLRYHFTLANTGTVGIVDIRASEKTDTSQHISVVPSLFSQLQPGGKMDIPRPVPLPFGGTHFSTTLMIRFKSDEGDRKERGADFQFWIPAELLKPGEFNPRGANFDAHPQEDPKESLAVMFLRDEGSLYFSAPAKRSDGTDNLVGGQNEKRRFLLDVKAKVAVFESKTSNGRVVHLSQPLVPPANGVHILALTWSDTGASLKVDDHPPKSDFDPPEPTADVPTVPKTAPPQEYPLSQIVLRSVASPKVGHVEEIPSKGLLSLFFSIRNSGPPTNFRILWIQLSSPDGAKNYNARMLADVGKDVIMKLSDGTNQQRIKETQNISIVQDQVIGTKIVDAYMTLLFDMSEAELIKIIEQRADLKIGFEDGLGNRAVCKVPNLHFGDGKVELDVPATILKPKT